MNLRLTRREMLETLLGTAVASPLFAPLAAVAAAGPQLGTSQTFSFQGLRERARRLADQPYRPSPPRHPELLDSIDYDTYQKIRFQAEMALWADATQRMPVQFHHLGRYTREPVELHVVSDGRARRIRYTPDLFDYSAADLRTTVPDGLGFAGFRVMNPGKEEGDWLSFMGASYFRSSGALDQYGLSARGIAVNTALPDREEEFPRFVALWLEQPRGGDQRITAYALLDGPSITGAYRFDCRRDGAVVMDIHAELFQREAIAQIGLAPLTSMYWFSETNRRVGTDWRPEIHDSDGLAIWTAAGERIWRALNNPPHLRTNVFTDRNPRGFGLLQRDRDFGNYQDDSVFYHRRPSVWVEPKGSWGDGGVQLVEMPTDDEIHDNIVAFWTPDRKADKGTRWTLDYRLHWTASEPYPPSVGRVVATRIGRSGVPGQHAERDPHGRKFVIDFTGGPLDELEQRYDLTVVATASRGRIANTHALKVVGKDRWRASFDLHAQGRDPVDMRCYVRLGDRTLTETWLYQFHPGEHGLPWP